MNVNLYPSDLVDIKRCKSVLQSFPEIQPSSLRGTLVHLQGQLLIFTGPLVSESDPNVTSELINTAASEGIATNGAHTHRKLAWVLKSQNPNCVSL